MQLTIPQDVLWILRKLNEAGHEAYVVGGCVRDSILEREPNDWDITTSAEPMEVKSIFRRTIDTGLQHGTVTVMNHGVGYEVTTYRADGDYSDHRRPDQVVYTRNLEEDLKRRDFTVNAMAYSPKDGLVDLFGGLKDLEDEVIRAVGDPDERFNEDALRILRAGRFSAQLGMVIEDRTAEAIARHAEDIVYVSAERIETELTKLICSRHPEVLEKMYSLGVTAQILPEFDRMMETPQNTPHHYASVGVHTMAVMREVSPTKVMRYAALLHDVAKPKCRTTDENGVDHFKGHPMEGAPMAEAILRRLKMDNKTIDDVKHLVYWHDFALRADTDAVYFRKGMSRMGMQYFPQYIELRKADVAGQSEYHREDKLRHIQRIEALHAELVESGAPLTLKDLAVKGKDLMEAGIPAGPGMGELLNRLLDTVLEDPAKNEKEILMEEVRRSLSEQKKAEQGSGE